MQDVLLIQPNIEDFYLTTQRVFPAGLWLIASYLKKHNISVSIFDILSSRHKKEIPFPYNFSFLKKYYISNDSSPFSLFKKYYRFGYDLNYVIDKIRKINPYIIGISSNFTTYYEQVLLLAKEIKKHFPEIIIIVGGHNTIIMQNEFLNSGIIDYLYLDFIPYEFYKLVKLLINKKQLNTVNGIAYKKDNSIIVQKRLVNRRSRFVIPDIDLIDYDKYKIGKYKAVSLVKNFGCPFKCSYCTSYKLYDIPFKFENKDLIQLMWDLYEKKNVQAFNFEDDNFVFNKTETIDFLSKLYDRFNNSDIRLYFMNGLNYKLLDEDIIDWLVKCGLKNLNLAAVSFEHNNYLIKRDYDEKKLFDIINYARKKFLIITVYLIVPLPNQTIEKILNFMHKLNNNGAVIGISPFYLYSNADMYDEYFDKIKNISFSVMRGSTVPIESTDIKRKDIFFIMRYARILNYSLNFKNENSHISYEIIKNEYIISKKKLSIEEKAQILINLFKKNKILSGISNPIIENDKFKYNIFFYT